MSYIYYLLELNMGLTGFDRDLKAYTTTRVITYNNHLKLNAEDNLAMVA